MIRGPDALAGNPDPGWQTGYEGYTIREMPSAIGERMRSFHDEAGREWDVTVGRESWGGLVLLFSPREGGDVRTGMLPSETRLDAEQDLTRFTEEELRQILSASRPWG